MARIAKAAAIADEALANTLSLLEKRSAERGLVKRRPVERELVEAWLGEKQALEERLSEAEVALTLDTEMRLLGADGPSFDTIVAVGPNGAEPHHHPSSRKVDGGELVVLDFGAKVDGYCSDMTRTIALGQDDLDPQLRQLFSVVLASQQAGLGPCETGSPPRTSTAPVVRSWKRPAGENSSCTGPATASGSTYMSLPG